MTAATRSEDTLKPLENLGQSSSHIGGTNPCGINAATDKNMASTGGKIKESQNSISDQKRTIGRTETGTVRQDDPRYAANVARCIERVRAVAKELGWAIGEHGSKRRDIDLIGVPWTEDAAQPLDLIFTLCDRLHFERGKIENKPHNRTGFSLLGGETMAEYVDLSLFWPHDYEAPRRSR